MKCPNCDFAEKDEAFGDPATCPKCGAIYEKALRVQQFKKKLEAQKAENAARQEASAKKESWLAKGLKGAADEVKSSRARRSNAGAQTLYTKDGTPVLVSVDKKRGGCLRPLVVLGVVLLLIGLFSEPKKSYDGYAARANDPARALEYSRAAAEKSKSTNELIGSAVCDGNSVLVTEVLRPIRNAPLRVGPSNDAERIINEKGTRATGVRMYHSVDSSARVLTHCERGGATYVTFTEPEWLKGIGGWVDTGLLRDKENPSNPYEGLISEDVLRQYADYEITGDSGDPRSGRFLGRDAEINAQKIAIARRVIDSGRCEYVSYVYFLSLESDISNPRYMVDCEKNKRIALTSNDLLSGAVIRTNEERAISRGAALDRCKELVRSQVIRKSTARYREILGSSYYVTPASGNVRQVLDFDAKNGLGQTVRHRAVCIFDPDGGEEITILEK